MFSGFTHRTWGVSGGDWGSKCSQLLLQPPPPPPPTPIHAKPTHFCNHPALPGRVEKQLSPAPLLLPGAHTAPCSPGQLPGVGRGGTGEGIRSAGPQSGLGQPALIPVHRPLTRGPDPLRAGRPAGVASLLPPPTPTFAAKDSPRLSLTRFPPRPVSSRGRQAGACSAVPRLRLATAGRRDYRSRRASRRLPRRGACR